MPESIVRPDCAWSLTQVEQYISTTRIPARIACLSENGIPLVCSLWFLYEGGALWCATPRRAAMAHPPRAASPRRPERTNDA